ncbi:DUF5518 domain-containing protein [candidate division KSB1 bacterium]|nr:DUF5518 domain-containing protein [candidate division KSB1 bacterium]
MQQPSKLMPAVWGGVIIAVLSAVPVLNIINCACCAGTMLGGVAAVYIYRKQMDPNSTMYMNDGAILGLLAGVFGAIIGTGLSYLFGGFSMEWLRHIAEAADDPEIDEMLEQLAPVLFSKGIILVSLVMNLIIDCLFGMIGALIGVAIFGKPQVPPAPTWQQPPQPPAQP